MAKYTSSISLTSGMKQKQISRTDFLSSIVQQLIKRRLQLALTQEDVDARMGNADRSVSKWECGDRTPSSFNLYCWAEVLESKIVLDIKRS